jgi:hypothetical protein
MTEFEILLERAGHRPAKHGAKWICADCPQGKTPALSVDLQEEVFFCWRCRKGGNLITLKWALGEPMRIPTAQEKRIRRAAEIQARRIEREFNAQRRGIIDRFKQQYDTELQAESKAKHELQSVGQVSDGTLEEYVRSAHEREFLEAELQALDRMPIEDIIEVFEAMQ